MKQDIIDYLNNKGVYHKGLDFTIDLLVSQVNIYNTSNAIINEEGLSVWGSAEQKFKVRNQHVKTLSECIVNIRSLSKSLGLSVSDSIIFKELKTDETDGFDDM